jgi:hypothetical protein
LAKKRLAEMSRQRAKRKLTPKQLEEVKREKRRAMLKARKEKV